MLHDILGHDHEQWHPQLIRHNTNLWTYYRNWHYSWFWPHNQISVGFHRTLQWVRLANRGRLLPRTPGPVSFGTCICSNLKTNFSWACRVFGIYISNIPRYFYFAFLSWMYKIARWWWEHAIPIFLSIDFSSSPEPDTVFAFPLFMHHRFY